MSSGAWRRAAGKILLTTVLMTVATSQASVAWSADIEIVILPGALEPSPLRVVAGRRVEFVNRANAAVHVEFAGDPGEHKMVQVSAAGPTWVIFYRPGTHPYVVHLSGPGAATLRGLVDVVEDPREPWTGATCGTVVWTSALSPDTPRARGVPSRTRGNISRWSIVDVNESRPPDREAPLCRGRALEGHLH